MFRSHLYSHRILLSHAPALFSDVHHAFRYRPHRRLFVLRRPCLCHVYVSLLVMSFDALETDRTFQEYFR